MYGHLYDLLRLLKNGQKYESFAAYFEQHFNTTTPHKDVHKYTTFKIIKQINPIGAKKIFTKTKFQPMYEGTLNDP